ncbi:MAG: hypothetical protein ACM3ME_03025 [Chloroflexota bacterium]
MRTFIVTCIIVILSINCFSQEEKSIPFKVDFRDDLIIITIPQPYKFHDIRPVVVPRFIFAIRSMQSQTYSPSKEELITLLEDELQKEPDDSDNERLTEYLNNVVLFLYLNKHNSSNLPQQARGAVERFNRQNLSMKKQINLVSQYIVFSDKMTQTK